MGVITSRATINAGPLGILATKPGTTFNKGNLKKDPVMGDNGVLGHTEKFESAPNIKCTLVDTIQTDVTALENFVNGTVLLETNNGKKYTLTDAWVGNELELNTEDGTLPVEFYGTELIPQ
tara:strand:+ start:29277 stop:29639 length:363 start_codon:yes stop_codon:yes gene_type:complete